MKYKSIVVINDCIDQAAMRQCSRIRTLLGITPVFLGIDNFADLQASGNIVDALDAFDGESGIIIANSAPRFGEAKKWPNGTPFCFFEWNESLIVSTIQGSILSLVKKLNLTESIKVTDLNQVIDFAVANNLINHEKGERIKTTQFRSFDYEPRLVKWIADGVNLPYEEVSMTEIPTLGKIIWYIDNFGNCKTTILPEDIEFEIDKVVETKIGPVKCYSRLKDVPNDEPALIIGSSGLGSKRFIEFVVQGGGGAKRFGLNVGDELI